MIAQVSRASPYRSHIPEAPEAPAHARLCACGSGPQFQALAGSQDLRGSGRLRSPQTCPDRRSHLARRLVQRPSRLGEAPRPLSRDAETSYSAHFLWSPALAKSKPWTEDEIVLALDLYCRTPFGRLHRTNPEIVRLASVMGRTSSAVAMKCCNFASLDPAERARGIRGLSGASQGDAEVFERLAHDVEQLDNARTHAAIRLGIPRIRGDDDDTDVLQEEQLVLQHVAAAGSRGDIEMRAQRSRGAQALFRKIVIVSYERACAVCSLRVLELLDAAHITPWSASPHERLDPTNGLALCSLHHRAYDRGLLTVDDAYRVVIAKGLRSERSPPLHLVALTEAHGQTLRLPRRFQPDLKSFSRHREQVFVDNLGH